MTDTALTTSLLDDLIAWLPVATPEDVLAYHHSLPTEKHGLIRELAPDLVERARVRRGDDLRELLVTNAAVVMSEAQLMRFIGAMVEYNTASVIKNFRHRYPTLRASNASDDVSDWALVTIQRWNNIFLLLTCQKYDNYAVYLKSILRLSAEPSVVRPVAVEASMLLSELDDQLAKSGFLRTPMPGDLRTRISSHLSKFTFLPKEYVSRISSDEVGEEIIRLFAALSYVLEIIAEGTHPESPDNETILLGVLREQLRFDEETNWIKAKTMGKDPEELAISVSEDDPRIRLLDWLDETLNLNDIDNGSCAQKLQSYFFKLAPNERDLFLDDLQFSFRESLAIQMLFEDLDLDSFISKVKNTHDQAARTYLIGSYRLRVDPTIWPKAEKAMQMIVSLF